ncbi:MAG: glycosyltransferase family 4 protein [Solirubrobacteraceae bacterium]
MKQAYICAFPPTLGSGRAMRTYTCVRALASFAPLDFVYADPDGAEPAPEYRAIPGVELRPVRPSRGAARGLAYGRMVATGTPEPLARGCSPEFVAAARSAAAGGYSRVVADMHGAAALLQRGQAMRAVYNAQNLESQRRQMTGPERSRGQARMRRFEQRLFAAAAQTWMVSRADLDGARALAPGADIRYVPNAVDVAGIAPAGPAAGAATVLMVADYTYEPNIQGADWMAGQVMPALWRERGDARLRLVGKGLAADRFGGDERIEVAGFVDDLAAAYAEAGCVCVPLLEGGGSPLKFIEALAYGMPVVGTSLAAAGLEVTAGTDFLEADDPGAFAAALARVLAGAAPRIGPAGRALAEREYSIQALARAMGPPDGAGAAAA